MLQTSSSFPTQTEPSNSETSWRCSPHTQILVTPGQIYDEALATLSACLAQEKGRVLVAFFGDNTYGWLEPENVVPFEPHFDEKSKQSEDHLFLEAVEEALFEVKKRSALGLTCKCLNPSNFRPTEVQGFLEIDVAGYGARSKYSVEQIKKARNGFKPREMFSFLQKLALNPTIDTQNNFTLTRNVARVLAYRKSVFEEPDETYPQEFEAQAADNEHHADVSYGMKKPHQARPQLEELEGSPQYPRPSDPLTIDDITKHAKLKFPEVGILNNNLRKNVQQKRSLQDTSMPQLRIFVSDDLSQSKKRSSPDVQEETITEKQKKGKTIDSMVARKKVVGNRHSDLRGDQINTKTATVANHEERSTEQIESLIQKRNLFGLSRPSYRIQRQKGSAAELTKWSKPNMQLPQEDRHQMERRTLDITLQYAKNLTNMNLIPTMDVYAIESVSGGRKNSNQTTRTPAEKVFAERVAAYPMGGRSWPYPAEPPRVYPPHYPAAVEEVGRLYPPPPSRYTQVGGLYPPVQGYAYPPAPSPPPGYGCPPPSGYGYPQPPQRGYGYPLVPPPPSSAYRPLALEEAPRNNIAGRWDRWLVHRRYDI
ncbi:UNVERIFIED_CONTAM: hypothetical protein Sangu_3122000 [Sesamum angustifolium]|uniref:PWWP domain-containing protein n=1 Tax=Sesamum angustifolium TaxID=2727405 RepID=A0AAW2K1I6_9LAMI